LASESSFRRRKPAFVDDKLPLVLCEFPSLANCAHWLSSSLCACASWAFSRCIRLHRLNLHFPHCELRALLAVELDHSGGLFCPLQGLFGVGQAFLPLLIQFGKQNFTPDSNAAIQTALAG